MEHKLKGKTYGVLFADNGDSKSLTVGGFTEGPTSDGRKRLCIKHQIDIHLTAQVFYILMNLHGGH